MSFFLACLIGSFCALTACTVGVVGGEANPSVRGTTTPAETATPEERAAEALQAVEISLPEGLTIVAVEDLEGFYDSDSGSWARTIEVRGDEPHVMRFYDENVGLDRSVLDQMPPANLEGWPQFVFVNGQPMNAALFSIPTQGGATAQATLLFERPLGRVWILVEGGIR